MQGIITGRVNASNPELLRNGNFVSLSWTRYFLKEYCGMSFKRITGKSYHLPTNWKQQMHHMACRVSYFMKLCSTPRDLVVNSDQTGIHLVPNAGYLFPISNIL
jgi:hypothetical protein